MTLLLTGATGHLGTLTAQFLTARDATFEISVRDPARSTLAVPTRQGDYAGNLDFSGVDTLIFVSSNASDDERVAQHKRVVDAAVAAGVGHIIYTSVTEAATSPLTLAVVHKTTEEVIAASGIPYTFLRNGMYHENYTAQLPGALESGTLLTATGSGRIASVARADLAEAAAVVATTPGHENKVYELTGPSAWSFDELAALATQASGKPLAHKSIPGPELVEILSGVVPSFMAELYVDIYVNISHGALAATTPDLEKLIGHASTPITEAVRAAL
jgi:NAD(P)H dehydrogenase (quinone)